MKTYEEMAKSALSRIDEHERIKRKRIKTVSAVALPVLCLCVVVLAVFSMKKEDMAPHITGDIVKPNAENTEKPDADFKYYISKAPLPKVAGELSDMIACVVYKGNVYTAGEVYRDGEVDKLEAVKGEYIGRATGELDEFSTDEWSKELASSFTGDIYKLEGYDDTFRICAYVDYGKGEQYKTMWVLDNFGDMGLSKGSDLFGEKLNILGNVESADCSAYLSRPEGEIESESVQKYAFTKEELESFVSVLCESPFEFIPYEENAEFIKNRKNVTLELNLKDGTRVNLGLYEGGYVRYLSDVLLAHYYVKMPLEEFNAVFEKLVK